MEKQQVLDALAALAHETRLDVFRLLVESGPAGLPVGAIASDTGVAATTLSFHLKALRSAGIATSRRRGRSLIYAPDFARMRALVAFLTENCCARAASGPPS